MEKIKSYFPIIAFLLVPFGFLSLGIIHQGHHFAIILAALVMLASVVKNKVLSYFLVFMALWQVFIFLYAMKHPQIPQIIAASGIGTVVFFIVGLSAYIAISQSNIRKEQFYNVICITSILQTVICICQKFGFDPIVWALRFFVPAQHTLTVGTVTGTLGNPNFVGAFLAISLPFFFRRAWSWFIPMIVLVLFLSRTASSVMPAIIGIGIFVWIKFEDYLKIESGKRIVIKRRYPTKNKTFVDKMIQGKNFYRLLIVSVITVLLVGYFFIKGNIMDSPRFQHWDKMIGMVTSYVPTIIFGMGPGALWGEKFPLHSEWMSCFHQFGVIGLCFFIAFIFTTLKKCKDRLLLTSFIIIIINLLGNSALHYAPTALLICMIGGLIERDTLWQNTKLSGISTKR